MKIERIYAVYFSPTHGTQKYVEESPDAWERHLL